MPSKRQFFEQLAPIWDDQQPANRDAILHQLLSPFDQYLQASALTLEVGTGTGALSSVFRQRYPSRVLISIDLAAVMLMLAKKRNDFAQYVQADVHWLPFPPDQFSAVVCHNCFPHFEAKIKALEEMRRVLCQAGYMLILHELGREKVNGIHQAAQNEVIHQDLLPSGDELKGQFLGAGFHPLIIEDTPDHYSACARKQ